MDEKHVNHYELGVVIEQSASRIEMLAKRMQSASRMVDAEVRRHTYQDLARQIARIQKQVDEAMFKLDIGLPEDMASK